MLAGRPEFQHGGSFEVSRIARQLTEASLQQRRMGIHDLTLSLRMIGSEPLGDRVPLDRTIVELILLGRGKDPHDVLRKLLNECPVVVQVHS